MGYLRGLEVFFKICSGELYSETIREVKGSKRRKSRMVILGYIWG